MIKTPYTLALLAFFGWACASSPSNPEFEQDVDTTELNLPFVDTLTLKEGELPADWHKEPLVAGYYLGFPTEPQKDEKKGLLTFKIKKKHYLVWASVRDMSKEESFALFKEDQTAYYYAISNDLADGLTLPDTKMDIGYKKSFTALQLHEGLETHFKSADAQIYTRCIVIDNNLYTMACLFWRLPEPALLQLKDRFFYSFGKDLEIQ